MTEELKGEESSKLEDMNTFVASEKNFAILLAAALRT